MAQVPRTGRWPIIAATWRELELELEQDVRQSPGESGRSPGVFIIGCPRSGTSVFSWALAAHPRFVTGPESDYLLYLFGQGRVHESYRTAYDRPDKGWLLHHQVGFREFAEALGLGVERLYESRSNGKRWVDATPSYTLMADILALMFPAAKFLHILRDGRAVVNSMSKSGFQADWAGDFKRACETWSHYARRAHRFQSEHPERALEVRYEALTRDPELEFARIFDFLGEDYSPRSAEFVSTKRINSSYDNERAEDIRKVKDPATAPSTPWQGWARGQFATFDRLAGEAMAEFGYAQDQELDRG